MSTQRVAIVTGAGRGIGRAIALDLARSGVAVVVNDLGTSTAGDGSDVSVAERVVDEIEAAGGRACASADSIATFDGAQRVVELALKRFDSADIVVNNAGIIRDREVWAMSDDEWSAVVRTHLDGSFYMIRAAAPHIRERAFGRIINITSTAGLVGHYGHVNYAAAKLGVVALANMTALEMADVSVTANSVAPFAVSRLTAAVRTPGGASVMPGGNRILLEQGRDPQEPGSEPAWMQSMTPEQVAPLVTYLASDRSAHVTGQVFTVRGREVVLFSQPRPLRSVVLSSVATPQTIEEAIGSLAPSFIPLAQTGDVFPYDPIV